MSDSAAAVGALRRFARASAVAGACCERCAGALDGEHRHLFETQRRALLCVCPRCADHRAGPPALLAVPDRVRTLPGLSIAEPLWRALGVPVELAFVGPVGDEVLAVYPGPAGATHTQVPLAAWRSLQTLHPALLEVGPEVEALLANRLAGAERYYVAPIDVCYRLVGLVRAHFRGLRGGAGLRAELARFFAELDARAEVCGD